MHARPAVAFLAIFSVLAWTGTALRAQTALPTSPFLPPTGASVAQAPLVERWQLTGISTLGKKTYVSLFDGVEKTTRWVTVGESMQDLEVISCDVEGDTAVVKVGGALKVLALRKPAAGGGGGPRQTGIGGGSFAQAAPLSAREEQEREARMMVSDLLEIGMIQRKAYEEKARKAAEEAAAKAAAKP